MSAAVMLAVSPGHRFLGAARLESHRLAFTRRSIRSGSGVADILADPSEEVWGTLYEIPDEELEALDRKEGVGFAYTRTDVRVHPPAGEAIDALAYAVVAKASAEIPPSPDYLQGILTAAVERSLPEHYLRSLHLLQAHWHGAEPGRSAQATGSGPSPHTGHRRG